MLKSNLQEFVQHRYILFLIAANTIPLIGVLFFSWSVSTIVFLYWTENLFVGFFNIIKMIMIGVMKNTVIPAILLTLFFIVHFGIFTVIQGIFVVVLFGFPKNGILLAAFLLFLSHGYSFVNDFVLKQAYKKVTLGTQMSMPYKRLFVLQVTVVIGGYAVLKLGSPIIALVLLVFVKTVVDILSYNTIASSN